MSSQHDYYLAPRRLQRGIESCNHDPGGIIDHANPRILLCIAAQQGPCTIVRHSIRNQDFPVVQCAVVLLALVPVVAISPILLYIGMLIGAQAFQTTPVKHAPAIVLALGGWSICAWGWVDTFGGQLNWFSGAEDVSGAPKMRFQCHHSSLNPAWDFYIDRDHEDARHFGESSVGRSVAEEGLWIR